MGKVIQAIYKNPDNPGSDNFLNSTYPVGSFYTQYPSANSNVLSEAFPDSLALATIFGGTWAVQWNDEAIFFRSEGEAASRTSGKQLDSMQGHRHLEPIEANGTGRFGTATSTAAASRFAVTTLGTATTAWQTSNPYTDGVNGTPRTNDETRPTNRLLRIWKRIA